MKRLALLAAVGLLTFATPSNADFSLGGEKFSAFVDFCVRSRYQVQYGISISDKPMACEEVLVKHIDSGVYIGSWWSQSITGRGNDSRDEKDFYVGINRQVGRFQADFQINYLHLSGIGGINEFALRIDSLAYPFYWKGSYLLGLSKNSPDGGFLTRAGFLKSFGLPLWHGYEQKIRVDAYVGGNVGGALGIKPGFTHTGLKVGFPIPLARNIDLTPTLGAQYTFPGYKGLGKGKVAPDNPVWGELNLTFRF